MGVHYTAVIWDIIIQNPGRKLVALAIADMAGRDGTCYPSVRYVSEMCNMHPDTVRDHLRHLEKLGLLKREMQIVNGRQTSNRYKFMSLEELRGRGDYSPEGGVGRIAIGGAMTNHPTQEPFQRNHLKGKGKGCGTVPVQHAGFEGFCDSNRRPYPTSEKEMYQILESFGIEPNPDRDGHFYEQMAGTGWRIRGKLIADWVAVYEARVNHTEESCKANHNRK